MTVSPNRQYRGIFRPTTPAHTGPAEEEPETECSIKDQQEPEARGPFCPKRLVVRTFPLKVLDLQQGTCATGGQGGVWSVQEHLLTAVNSNPQLELLLRSMADPEGPDSVE